MSIFCWLVGHKSVSDIPLDNKEWEKITPDKERFCLRCGKELIFWH